MKTDHLKKKYQLGILNVMDEEKTKSNSYPNIKNSPTELNKIKMEEHDYIECHKTSAEIR